jgi:hypothetical protein
MATGGLFCAPASAVLGPGRILRARDERRHQMTTSGYNPTGMPGPETRYFPRIPDFTPRTSDGIITDGSKAEGD